MTAIRPRPEDNDGGSTLVEILTVTIILAVLAAIAIPAFLSQKDKGYVAAVKSDLKNAQIAQETFASENKNAYVFTGATGLPASLCSSTCTLPEAILNLRSQGLRLSAGDTVDAIQNKTGAGGYAYCVHIQSSQGSGTTTTGYFVIAGGVPTAGGCP